MSVRPRTIVLAGALARRLDYAGHAWVFLNYLLGFRRLGYEVHLLDWLDAEACGGPVASSQAARALDELLRAYGLDDAYTLLDGPGGDAAAGRPREQALAAVRRSRLLLDVMGYLRDDELLAAAPRRAFLDVDPGFGQMWRALGQADVFAGHDVFLTFGQNVGAAGCAIPDLGLDWLPTVPPVVLEHWPVAGGAGGSFTTVGAWRGPYDAVVYEGERYGLRAHEFRKHASLPRLVDASFAAALDLEAADAGDRELLERNGWQLLDPAEAVASTSAYRDFVASSAGEVMIPKEMYVRSRSGWFGDRSACYLASGRPVVAVDTGLSGYPRDEGLLLFDDVDEAAACVEEVQREPERHRRAARALAEERFDSDRVLARLLAEAGAA